MLKDCEACFPQRRPQRSYGLDVEASDVHRVQFAALAVHRDHQTRSLNQLPALRLVEM